MSGAPDRPEREHPPSTLQRVLRSVGTLVVVAALLAGAVAVRRLIRETEPTAQREAATRKSAALVETVIAERAAHRPVIRVIGAVRPAREIVLSPRVSGEIIAVDEAFRPGGIVSAGDPLLEIDPADYQQALVLRESELGQVQAELAIEKGQQRVAELEFKLLGDDIDPANRSLVLREPQIASLRSKLRGAKAAIKQAQLQLERTAIKAPFDAQILERFTELGAQVGVGERLARLAGTDEYWVVATVPLGKLRWIAFPRDGTAGARARIRHRSVWAEGQFREGAVQRLIGEVDTNTRLARVIVSVPQPLKDRAKTPLILGTLVQVEIEITPVEDVVRLERALLRQNDTVWVMQKGELRIRKVEVVFSNDEHAFVRDGLEDGDRIVTTNLATVSEGLPIREAAATGDDARSGAAGPEHGGEQGSK